MKITTIAGTRPEIIKLDILVDLLNENYASHEFFYTGQHSSPLMKDIFFQELGIGKPHYDLSVGSSDYGKLTKAVHSTLKQSKPDYVIVYGDTNSTVAGADAAKSVGSKLIHVEAGLRSFDDRMPEERNRKHVDDISDFHFAPTDLSKLHLTYEGCPQENIFVTGNLVVDACHKYLPIALKRHSYEKPFLLVTLHRKENVDNPKILKKFIKKFSNLSEELIFPIHPRTKQRLLKNNIDLPDNIKSVEPLGYLDFLNAQYNCEVVLTDSGGVQEEAITIGKPCITLRRSTERQETLLIGANVLYPIDSEADLGSVINDMRSRSEGIKKIKNPYGEKGVARKMLNTIRCIAN